MPKTQKNIKQHTNSKRVIGATRKRLAGLIALLLITITTLALKVGQKLWPVWLSEYLKSLIGILVFFVVFLVLLSPIIVAANSNPRPLSGAGQNPYTKKWFDIWFR
jgi:hypothetical protein